MASKKTVTVDQFVEVLVYALDFSTSSGIERWEKDFADFGNYRDAAYGEWLVLDSFAVLNGARNWLQEQSSELYDKIARLYLDRIAQIVPAGLKQEGGIEKNRFDFARLIRLVNLLFQNLSDPGVNNLFQVGPRLSLRGRRSKHAPPQFGSVNLSLTIEN